MHNEHLLSGDARYAIKENGGHFDKPKKPFSFDHLDHHFSGGVSIAISEQPFRKYRGLQNIN
jgi:hypothetical protein